MVVKVIAYACFYGVFAVGCCTTLYGVGKLGYGAYKKIKETFSKKNK